MMNKLFPVIFFSLMLMVSAVGAEDVEIRCLPEETTEIFETVDNSAGIQILATGSVQATEMAYVKDIYNQLLMRDDNSEGRIRAAIEREAPTILIFEDADDMDEFYEEHWDNKTFGGCYVQELLQEEIIIHGSPAAQYEFVDTTLNEIVYLIHLNGIKKAYPSWDQRLQRASKKAVKDMIYKPKLFDPEEPDPEYLPQDDHDISTYSQYLAVGLEVYYGYWKDKDSVMSGGYEFPTREAMQEGDPELFNLIEEIFPQSLFK